MSVVQVSTWRDENPADLAAATRCEYGHLNGCEVFAVFRTVDGDHQVRFACEPHLGRAVREGKKAVGI